MLAGAAPPKEQSVGSKTASQVQPTALSTPDYSPYPRYNPDPCYQAKHHDTADLCAQWRAAIAAEKAADASHQSNLISAIGAILSFISIALVFFALRQTEKSLKAARDANDIAQDTAKRQLRAYIVVTEAFYDLGSCKAYLNLVNMGQTPAHDVYAIGAIRFAESPPNDLSFDKETATRGAVGPNVPFHIEIAQDEETNGPRGAPIHVVGEIRYTDIFGERWVKRFSLSQHGPFVLGRLTNSIGGNSESRLRT